MKIKKFIKDFNGCPIDCVELAQAAIEVEDSPLFVKIASDFLDAHSEFESYLASFGVELG